MFLPGMFKVDCVLENGVVHGVRLDLLEGFHVLASKKVDLLAALACIIHHLAELVEVKMPIPRHGKTTNCKLVI